MVTGEGAFDATSLAGTVVGEVVIRAAARGVSVLVIAGRTDADARRRLPDAVSIVDLVAEFGLGPAVHETLACVATAVRDHCAPPRAWGDRSAMTARTPSRSPRPSR